MVQFGARITTPFNLKVIMVIGEGIRKNRSICPSSLPQLQIEPLMESSSRAGSQRAHGSGPVSAASIRTSPVWVSPAWIAAIALIVRVGWIVIGHTYKFKNTDDNFGFGWEMGRIAAALASGHGFSSPFGPATGPTAWEPPLYPYLTAGVFLVFGIYSKASAFVLLSLNSIFSALTCVPIFLIARRIFSEKVAVGSAWTWALLPNIIFWCTRAIWETSLAALLLTLIFWVAAVVSVRAAVGRDGIEQHFPAVVFAGCGIVGVVPAGEARQPVVRRSGAGVGGLLCLHRAVAGTELRDVWQIHFHSRQLWGRTTAGKWERG
jgi:hypothetical protein